MRLLRRTLLAFVCGAWLAGCVQEEAAQLPTAGTAPRVVSLAPHLTELAYSAGAGERLVGVVAYSDYPEAARSLPRIGDAFNLDYERLAELAPDLVLAWKSGTPAPVRERLESLGFKVIVLETRTLEDVPERLIELGRLIGDEALALARAEQYREALRSLHSPAPEGSGIRVFYQVSLDPLYTVGGRHFISEIISLCGGRNIFAALATPAAAVSREAVLAEDPQIILSDQQSIDEARAAWAMFTMLSAIRNSGVHGIDADLVTRPTLRLADGARQVCAAIRSTRRQGPDQ